MPTEQLDAFPQRSCSSLGSTYLFIYSEVCSIPYIAQFKKILTASVHALSRATASFKADLIVPSGQNASQDMAGKTLIQCFRVGVFPVQQKSTDLLMKTWLL